MSKVKISKNKNIENKKAEDLNERWRLLYGAEEEDVSEGEGVRVIVTVRTWVNFGKKLSCYIPNIWF